MFLLRVFALTSLLAVPSLQIDSPAEKITEMSTLAASKGGREVIQVRDRLIRSMAGDGAFEADEKRYLAVLEAIQLALDKQAVHPLSVALVLWNEGEIRDPNVLIGAILRNVTADNQITADDIQDKFGDTVSDLLTEVVGARSLASYSKEAKLIELAEKLYCLRELENHSHVDWEGIGATPWTQVRRDNYFEWTEQMIGNLRGASPTLEAEIDDLFEKHRAEIAGRK